MKIASINDFSGFVQRHDLLPVVNGDVERLNFFRYGPLDASSDQSWTFSHGCHEEYCPCNLYPGCYVFDNGDSYSLIVSNDDKVARLLLPGIIVLVLLPMVIDYHNGCVRARSLDIAAQINIMG
jgi:hypothetical protein